MKIRSLLRTSPYLSGNVPIFSIGKLSQEKEMEFEFTNSLRKSLKERINSGFIKTYKPVMDDEKFRAFDTMEQYRQWCEKNLPDWLGYGRV